MTNYTSLLLGCTRQEPRRVGKYRERHAEAIAHVHEPGALLARGGVEAAAEMARLVGDHADRRALDPSEADDQVARPARAELEQLTAVDEARDHVAHVVDATRLVGHGLRRIVRERRPRRVQRER